MTFLFSVINHPSPAIHQTNPWAKTSPAHMTSSPATAESYQAPPSPATNPFLAQAGSNSLQDSAGQPSAINFANKPLLQHTRSHSVDSSNVSSWQQQQHQQQQQNSKKQTLLEMAHHQSFQLNGSTGTEPNWGTTNDWAAPYTQTSQPVTNTNSTHNQAKNNTSAKGPSEDTFDPFDVAWAAKPGTKGDENAPQTNNVSNPFATKTVTTYKVEL